MRRPRQGMPEGAAAVSRAPPRLCPFASLSARSHVRLLNRAAAAASIALPFADYFRLSLSLLRLSSCSGPPRGNARTTCTSWSGWRDTTGCASRAAATQSRPGYPRTSARACAGTRSCDWGTGVSYGGGSLDSGCHDGQRGGGPRQEDCTAAVGCRVTMPAVLMSAGGMPGRPCPPRDGRSADESTHRERRTHGHLRAGS
jgi:hypothetical protein